jgi:hypothetical protein
VRKDLFRSLSRHLLTSLFQALHARQMKLIAVIVEQLAAVIQVTADRRGLAPAHFKVDFTYRLALALPTYRTVNAPHVVRQPLFVVSMFMFPEVSSPTTSAWPALRSYSRI